MSQKKFAKSKTRIPILLGAVLLLMGLVSIQLLVPPKTQSAGGNLGTGRVTSVISSTGSQTSFCVSGPDGNATSVQSWEVAAGGIYDVTISNVTECSGPSIQVIVRSSSTGNQVLTANATANAGEYTFTIPMPTNACNTYPIEYCTTGGQPGTGVFARRNDGVAKQSHLRAAEFDANCGFLGEDTDCSTQPPQGAISACKYYDANTNGVNDGELPLSGWPMTLVPLPTGALPYLDTQNTDSTGCVTWSGLDPGFNPYSVTEGTPTQPNWVHTTAGTVSLNVVANETVSASFGNVCLGAGGGMTLGFWSNRNGQALITGAQLCTLNGLNLRDGAGNNFDPIVGCPTPSSIQISNGKTALKNWLLSGSATNMAYMLSVQFAAMELNVLNGKVNSSALIYAPGTNSANAAGFATVGAILSEANAELGLHGTAYAGDSWRSYQEALKNALDNANNNLTFVQPQPCAYSF